MKNEKHKHRRHNYKLLLIIIIVISMILMWARFMSTHGLVVLEYPVKTDGIDSNYDGFKIVQFSDLHYGSTTFIPELKNMVSRINDQHPDIVVFTGDLVERNVKLSDDDIANIVSELGKIVAKTNVLAVKGNHDYESKYFDQISELLSWKVLNNTYEYFYNDSLIPIIFVGFDDSIYGAPNYSQGFDFLNSEENDYYKIILVHEPDQVDHFLNYDFDLVLSGHSHLGQVRLPLLGAIYTPIGSKKYYDSHYKIKSSDLFISGGVGTSTVKLRFFNKPSISLYRFYKTK